MVVALHEEALVRQADPLDRTTRGVLIRLKEDVLALNPKGVVLLIGTNDVEEKATPEVIAGNLKLASEVRFNPKLKTNMLENMAVTFRDMSMHAGSSSVAGWWRRRSSR